MLEIFVVTVSAIYYVPFMVAAGREHPLTMPILAANVLIGWTGVGWLAVLLFAIFAPKDKTPMQRREQFRVV
jgi:hypothetical protein